MTIYLEVLSDNFSNNDSFWLLQKLFNPAYKGNLVKVKAPDCILHLFSYSVIVSSNVSDGTFEKYE